jgi:hypothetical protein
MFFAYSTSGADTFNAMTELARKFGPFFFSVLFLTYMIRWAQKKYVELTSRKDPTPTPQEKIIHASVFLGTFLVGIVLVGISVRWWLHFGEEHYVYRGVFRNLHSYEQVDSDEGVGMFFHDETKKPNGPLGPDTDLIHNAHFVVVQPNSFVDCQRFPVNLAKGEAGNSESFEIEYRRDDESEPAFTIEWDQKLLKNIVKREHPPIKPCSTGQIATVYASTLEASQVAKRQSKGRFDARQAAASQRPALSADIEVLQDTRTTVGSKLRAIQDFAALPQTDQNVALSSVTDVEPLLVTFLDLTRHSDKELAYHVITVLQNFDSDSFVIGLIRSGNSDLRTTALTDIEHMESPQVDRLLEKLRAQNGSGYSVVFTATRDLAKFQRLRPTGSPQGDRYYVRATWDSNNPDVTGCLTKLFNSELISNRSLQQENVKMQGRNNRLVYWYTKDWAEQIAQNVRQCGGRSEYVSP